MTVEEYIEAIKNAVSSSEILKLWSNAAGESSMTISDIIDVHRSCGQIVTNAALAVRAEGTEGDMKFNFRTNKK